MLASERGPETAARQGMWAALGGMALNAALASVKLVAGLVGTSYALVADAVESMTDIVSSAIVWQGLRVARRPADADHPYGHGKAETLAAAAVALMLCGAAIAIAVQATLEILTPHHMPAPFTLWVLLGVMAIKEGLFRVVRAVGRRAASAAVLADAWHHRSDAITSLAAAVGIGAALYTGYPAADDWAALFASGVIAFNAVRLLRPVVGELMDAAPAEEVAEAAATVARGVPRVALIETVRGRKMGLSYVLDMHIQVDPQMSVADAHVLAHQVKDTVRASIPAVADVLVHVEPHWRAATVSGGGSLRAAAVAVAALGILGLGLAMFAPSPAGAHGEHGDAAPALHGRAMVRVAGYEVELLANPVPPVAGQPVKFVAAVRDAATGRAPTGGRVFVGLGPATHREPPQAVPEQQEHLGHFFHSPGAAPANSAIRNPQSAMPVMLRAREEGWAGNYAALFRPERRGPHVVRVQLAELHGQAINAPAIVDFSVEVAPPPPLVSSTLLWVGLVAGVALAGGWAVRARARLGVAEEARLNLLDISWIRRALTGRWLQPALQVPLVVLTLLLVLLGFGDTQDPARNLATKLTWTIWWAGIIFTFVFLGRAWCYVCPYGGLNDWAERLAGPRGMFPRALRTLWPATAMFLLLTWADEQLGVVRSPRVTAWILVGLAVLAVGAGLLFQRRSFCRYLCPIGGVIGLYSMLAPVELRAASGEVCRGDKGKACYRGSERSYGCPMFEFPQVMDRNTYCTLCMECVKGCPLNNMTLRARPFGVDLWASAKRQLDEGYLAAVMMGVASVVTAAMIAPWKEWMVALGRLLPVNPIRWMRPITYLSLVDSVVFFAAALVVGPGLVLAAAWLAERRVPAEDRLGLRRAFTTFAYAAVPLGLAMHLAHNLEHLLVEGPAVVPVLQRTAARFLGIATGDPDWLIGPLVAPDLIPWFQVAVLLALFGLGLAVAVRLARSVYPDPAVAARATVPLFALLVLVTAVNIFILAQPMGARHAM